MSHKAKGLSKNQPLTVFLSLGWILSSPMPIAALVCAGPGCSLQNYRAFKLEGWCFPLLWPRWCQYPPAGFSSPSGQHTLLGTPLLCAPLKKELHNTKTNNKKYHRKHFPSLSSYRIYKQLFREISLKQGKIIKNQWNSNVRQSTAGTERGRQAFHHQQLPVKQLQPLLWNAP